MLLRDLNGKNVCILGYGKEGRAMVQALETFAPNAEITIADRNAQVQIEHNRHWRQLGEGWLENLHKFDVIIASPGIPPRDLERPLQSAPTATVTNATQIFLDEARARGALVIGVTGSKGKSTTSSLIYHIIKNATQAKQTPKTETSKLENRDRSQQPRIRHQQRSTSSQNIYLLGNIGEPSIAHVGDATPDTIFVLEMSSYQLLRCTRSPQIAVITSFFPEHLDYHGTLESYREAKANISRFQTADERTYFNATFQECRAMAEAGKGKYFGLTDADAPIAIGETKLLGRHNLGNITLAFRVCQDLGVEKKDAIAAIQSFTPLPHRLQSLGVVRGAEWIDDAISTTPESTIAALDALGDRVNVILLGGQDRGLDFASLGKRIAASDVRTVILFPGSGPRIRKAIEDAKSRVTCIEVQSMEEAVQAAVSAIHKSGTCPPGQWPDRTGNQELLTRHAQHLPIVLLSPASPSYGMYKNFEEKGDHFCRCARAMTSV